MLADNNDIAYSGRAHGGGGAATSRRDSNWPRGGQADRLSWFFCTHTVVNKICEATYCLIEKKSETSSGIANALCMILFYKNIMHGRVQNGHPSAVQVRPEVRIMLYPTTALYAVLYVLCLV